MIPFRAAAAAARVDRRRAVPSALVIVARVHHFAEPAFELEAHHVSVEQRAARTAGQLTGRQCGRQQRAARMRQRHEAHVVEVERMCGHAVGHRRPARARPDAGSEHQARTASFVLSHRLHGARGRFDGARQRDAHRVANRRRRLLAGRLRRDTCRHELREPPGVPGHQ